MTSSNALLHDAVCKYESWFAIVCIYLQNFPSKISPYIIRQNKLQLFTLYSMNATNWLSTLLFVILKAHLKSSMNTAI